MTDHHQLPPLPRGCRTLNNSESERIAVASKKHWPSPEKCRTCQGNKTFRWYAEGSRTEVVTYDCRCDDQWELHRYLGYGGIALAYQRLGWADYEGQPEAREAIEDYIAHAGGRVESGIGMLLRGSQGTGKTMLAVLLLKALLAEGHDAYHTVFYEMVSNLMDGWKSKEDRTWFESRVRNAGVLVVDDVGREFKQTAFVKGEGSHKVSPESAKFTIESVLRYRIASALPTIITTNFTVDEMTATYGSNFHSLLTEAAVEYEFTGASYRSSHNHRITKESDGGLSRPVVIG